MKLIEEMSQSGFSVAELSKKKPIRKNSWFIHEVISLQCPLLNKMCWRKIILKLIHPYIMQESKTMKAAFLTGPKQI